MEKESKERKLFVLHVKAPNAMNGAPRRLFLVAEGGKLVAIDEEYAGEAALRAQFPGASVREVVHVAASEYKRLLRAHGPLTGASLVLVHGEHETQEFFAPKGHASGPQLIRTKPQTYWWAVDKDGGPLRGVGGQTAEEAAEALGRCLNRPVRLEASAPECAA